MKRTIQCEEETFKKLIKRLEHTNNVEEVYGYVGKGYGSYHKQFKEEKSYAFKLVGIDGEEKLDYFNSPITTYELYHYGTWIVSVVYNHDRQTIKVDIGNGWSDTDKRHINYLIRLIAEYYRLTYYPQYRIKDGNFIRSF